MYARILFRGAKICKILKKGVLFAMFINILGHDEYMNKTNAECMYEV